MGSAVERVLVARTGWPITVPERRGPAANGQRPTALDFTACYDSTSGELSVSRYSLRCG